MTTLPAPCLACGIAATLTQGRCGDCHRAKRREYAATSYERHGRRQRPEREVQASKWKRLSKRARALQPFCTDCHRTPAQLAEHEQLEADHTPAAWAAVLAGRAITLQMVEVVCSTCNVARGPAQPGSHRYEQWEPEQVSADA